MTRLVLACNAALLLGCAPHSAAPDATRDWTVRELSGEEVRLSELRGKTVFINVWATWCAPCVAELASIERLQSELADADVAFLVVSPQDAEVVKTFASRHRYTLPLHVEVTAVPARLRVDVLPTTVVLDANGDVVLHHRGAAEWDAPAVVTWLRSLAQ